MKLTVQHPSGILLDATLGRYMVACAEMERRLAALGFTPAQMAEALMGKEGGTPGDGPKCIRCHLEILPEPEDAAGTLYFCGLCFMESGRDGHVLTDIMP